MKRTNDKLDGCATFFNKHKFKLVQAKDVSYFVPGVTLLNRDNVGLILLLQPRDVTTSDCLCIANTHLLYNPKRGDVKLAQLQLLFAEIDGFVRKSDTEYWPVVLCGDFNSHPHSKLYEFVRCGSLQFYGLPSKTISGQEKYYQRGPMLSNEILPAGLGISDQCQYMNGAESPGAPSNHVSGQGRKREMRWNHPQQPSAFSQEMKKQRNWFDQPAHRRPMNVGVGSQHQIECFNQSAAGRIISDQFVAHLHGLHGYNDFYSSIESEAGFNPRSLSQGSGTLSHAFGFRSVYEHFRRVNGRQSLEVTTSHSQTSCTVDYIFYGGSESIELVDRYELFTESDMTKVGSIPHQHLSSDHFLLMAAFQWCTKPNERSSQNPPTSQ